MTGKRTSSVKTFTGSSSSAGVGDGSGVFCWAVTEALPANIRLNRASFKYLNNDNLPFGAFEKNSKICAVISTGSGSDRPNLNLNMHLDYERSKPAFNYGKFRGWMQGGAAKSCPKPELLECNLQAAFFGRTQATPCTLSFIASVTGLPGLRLHCSDCDGINNVFDFAAA
jgi:hypothetical protein